jgi:hypothetical protein
MSPNGRNGFVKATGIIFLVSVVPGAALAQVIPCRGQTPDWHYPSCHYSYPMYDRASGENLHQSCIDTQCPALCPFPTARLRRKNVHIPRCRRSELNLPWTSPLAQPLNAVRGEYSGLLGSSRSLDRDADKEEPQLDRMLFEPETR